MHERGERRFCGEGEVTADLVERGPALERQQWRHDFLGPWSPVSLGDYAAGSNHVLPTSGTARFASGLSVLTFLRPVQMIDYSRAALTEIGQRIVTLAEAERLPAHGAAIRERLTA